MSKNTIYITGHKNPDSDSIISAMAYAYLKQQQKQDAIAIRIGDVNKETQYILSLFNEFAPPYVASIRNCIRDIEYDSVATCREDDNLYTALDIMKQNGKKVIAVVDEQKHLLGMCTMNDIVAPMMPDNDANNYCIRETPIEKICDFIDGNLIYKAANQHTNGHVHIIASCNDKICQDRVVITCDDEQLHKGAIENRAATLIALDCEGFCEEVINLAKANQCNLILGKGAVYTVAKNIYYASPIRLIMNRQLTTFGYDDPVDDVKEAINNSRFRSYPVLDAHNHIVGLISRYHLFKNTGRNLILVDHNELSQSVEGAENANILEIIDHHRLGGTQTSAPTYVRNERVGCCCTIISKLFKENNIFLPNDLAGMMCCAIISDTVNFKSLTCTQQDRDEAKYLAEKAGLNMDEIAMKILMSGASLEGTPDEIFRYDLKRFEIHKRQVTVSQCNIVSIDSLIPFIEQYRQVLSDYGKDTDSAIVVMAFTVIDGSGSYLLIDGKDKRLLDDMVIAKGKETNGFVFFEGMISRKMQIIPMISEYIGL